MLGALITELVPHELDMIHQVCIKLHRSKYPKGSRYISTNMPAYFPIASA